MNRPDILSVPDQKISILLLEDNPADAKLILHALQRSGFSVQHQVAVTSAGFKQLLTNVKFDLVLVDYYVPGWTGIEAIRWVKEAGLGTPIIVITGSLGDEDAVECLKEGASDYVLKDKLERLPVAVNHVLQEQRLREARDRALEELRQSEEQYRLLFNSNPQPMWVYDLDTLRFLAVNDASIEHYGYSREEFLKMTLQEVRPEEEIPRLLHTLPKIRNEKLKKLGSWKHRKKSGEIIDVELTKGKLRFEDRPAALICIEDVTERRVLERQFLQAQKMEAVGRLAGGVAHDFNNLLMVISSSAQLIQEGFESRERVDKYATQIRDAANKAAGLTRQLLAFSRQQVQERIVLDLNAIVRDIGKMLPRLLGEDIEVVFALDPALGRINADRAQMEQILMNLAVNARDAMPTGGKLTIETSNIELDQDYLRDHGVRGRSGNYILLAVTDTGTGMSHEVQSRIFEPFFTTKELGKGSGLGLATVYGIVKQNEGWVWVYSEVGHGTSFKVYLPGTEEVLKGNEVQNATLPLEGTETILLVEDADALRQVTAEYLENKGYRVLQAGNGPQALDVFNSHSEDIQVVITDMVMPGFGGPKLAEGCLAKRPGTRIIFVSGYAEAAVSREIGGRPAVYLQKPFSLNLLAQKLRSLLNESS